ncbi:hypothetical protein [Intrasporangium sp. YIM S08009]|uniref:hypothetical protein n=1 Tax=Intrasporangium zincisolvens TaxID=3080018 RepID=UPI002B05E877|nr:hypothetical protein [Intrasporangium sp. YIM S08009]
MQWIPEPKPPTGGLAAEGFYKLLGRPRLDPLTVLVRETAQNSWDARLDGGRPVDFGIEGWILDDSERSALRNQVFVNAARARGTGLAQALSAPELVGIYITDRHTKGLSGPVQADQADPEGVYDWVDFVLNVGEANTQGHTGGTYGFGKTISYVVSSANAVVVHSRTVYKGQLQTRLIACAIGEKFSAGGKVFTGRHWWAIPQGDAPVPATGEDADRLAEAIGMPGFEGDETGTNILVIAPDLGGRRPEQAMRFIAESVTWHLWPKLMAKATTPPMIVEVMWNGQVVPIPRPEERPPLHGFAQAFRAIQEGAKVSQDIPGLKIEGIRCQRPKTLVGTLATVPLIHRDRVAVDDGHDPEDAETPRPAAAITGVCHHVALLRTPELVVDYLQGPPPPEGGTEWAGVFRAHDDQDGHFAAAEPPTHDSWNPELLPKSSGRTIVNVGLREIRTALENRWAQRNNSRHADATSTALIADELGHLLGPLEGRARGRHRKDVRRTPTGPAKPKVDFIHSGPIEVDGELATLARVSVVPGKLSGATRLHVAVAAALDGTSGDADLDPRLALIAARVGGQPEEISGLAGRLDLVWSSAPVEVELVVRRSADTTVLFDLEAEPVL